MSRHLPLTRPGRPVLRRGPSQVQIGVDPERAVVVDHLGDVASAALLRLDGATGRHAVLGAAPELERVLDALQDTGVLDDDPGPAGGLSAARRERLGPDLAGLALTTSSTLEAARILVRRHRATVAVRGNDRAAAHVALGLAAAGVGTVVLEGPDRVTTLADVTAVGPFEPQVSWRGELAEALRRQGAHPTSVGRRSTRPSVVLLCSAADSDLPWTDPELADDLLGDGLPHLPVAVSGDRARVGPLVLPGLTACLWCVDRRARDHDAAWPALADQLRLRHPRAWAQSGVLAAVAGAFAVAQALQVVDGAAPGSAVCADAQVEFRAPDCLPEALRVVRHPVCGCGWAEGSATMVG
jgi:hypothetical protein